MEFRKISSKYLEQDPRDKFFIDFEAARGIAKDGRWADRFYYDRHVQSYLPRQKILL